MRFVSLYSNWWRWDDGVLQTCGNLFQSEGAIAALPKPVFHQVISVALYFHRPLQPIHNSCPTRAQMVIESAKSRTWQKKTEHNWMHGRKREKNQRNIWKSVKKNAKIKTRAFACVLMDSVFAVAVHFFFGFGRLFHLVVFTTNRCD